MALLNSDGAGGGSRPLKAAPSSCLPRNQDTTPPPHPTQTSGFQDKARTNSGLHGAANTLKPTGMRWMQLLQLGAQRFPSRSLAWPRHPKPPAREKQVGSSHKALPGPQGHHWLLCSHTHLDKQHRNLDMDIGGVKPAQPRGQETPENMVARGSNRRETLVSTSYAVASPVPPGSRH